MTGWRLEPTGVNRALADTTTSIEDIATALGTVVDTPAQVQTAGGYDGIVATAFQGFLQEAYEGLVPRMFRAYGAALEGTATAANAYLAGDEEMAATIAAGLTASDIAAASYQAPPAPADGGEG